VRATKKLRKLKDAPRLIPPVGSTVRDRKHYRSPKALATRKDGIAQRTAMRRLLKKKLALITPAMIDKKSEAWQNYQQVIKNVTSDMGGRSRLSTVEQILINALAATTVRLSDLTARQLLGGESSLPDHKAFNQTVSSLVRLSGSLGIDRRPSKELPSLSSYLSKKSNGGDTIDGEIVDHD
jgi:hypothetical protein